jgi:hypothetical protein
MWVFKSPVTSFMIYTDDWKLDKNHKTTFSPNFLWLPGIICAYIQKHFFFIQKTFLLAHCLGSVGLILIGSNFDWEK